MPLLQELYLVACRWQAKRPKEIFIAQTPITYLAVSNYHPLEPTCLQRIFNDTEESRLLFRSECMDSERIELSTVLNDSDRSLRMNERYGLAQSLRAKDWATKRFAVRERLRFDTMKMAEFLPLLNGGDAHRITELDPAVHVSFEAKEITTPTEATPRISIVFV